MFLYFTGRLIWKTSLTIYFIKQWAQNKTATLSGNRRHLKLRPQIRAGQARPTLPRKRDAGRKNTRPTTALLNSRIVCGKCFVLFFHCLIQLYATKTLLRFCSVNISVDSHRLHISSCRPCVTEEAFRIFTLCCVSLCGIMYSNFYEIF